MTATIVDQAEALLREGRAAQALRLLNEAARGDDVSAVYELAMWSLVGKHLPRDLIAARAYLRRATAMGHADAALVEIALTANGAGAAPDWSGAFELLRLAARNDPLAADHLSLLNAMAIDAQGLPVAAPIGKALAAQPATWLFPGFLSPAECAHIASIASDVMEPAQVVDPLTGRFVTHPVRTSSGAVIGPSRETLVVQAINRRLAVVSDTDVTQGEPLQVLHYAPGQQFRPHHDALPPSEAAGNQRIRTMLLYLNDAYAGGATRFTATGMEMQGRGGDLLMFDNLRPDGAPDPAAQHAGLPVTRGAKWLATRWIRQKPYDAWAVRAG
ncbi:MAG: 2OG-Fe(II) oxygenase [Sphingobium sp.]